MKHAILILSILLSFVSGTLAADEIPERYLRQQWDAHWIDMPGSDGQEYAVYYFRKDIDIQEVPESFPVYVSADNRYELYVNGELVSMGPARCDIEHWVYEQPELAPYLKVGRNAVVAKVWNEGPGKAEAQFSLRTAFILQGASKEAEVLNTDASWKCTRDHSYGVSKEGQVFGYFVVSPSEKIDMGRRVLDWSSPDYDDSTWVPARRVFPGTPKLTVGIDVGKTWRLTPSQLPQMELKPQRFDAVRRSQGIKIPSSFPRKEVAVTVPAGTKVSFILDNKVLTNAFPTVKMRGGAGATLKLVYAEALYNPDMTKGNRNEIEGKTLYGRTDVLLADGSEDQSFTSLFYRSFRYVEVQVETASEPLVIEDIYSTFVGFPFEQKASLRSEDPTLQKMMEIGWRTARLCAVETYMDCPYYEQLQYAGDARIQAMISLYNAGDPRLMKNLLTLIDNSRQPEGITQSRYPSVNPQIIPTYSMCQVWMVHDYMMYADDAEFVKSMIPGTRQIISYFERFQNADGSIRNLPNWTFVDWVDAWNRGKCPIGSDGGSAILDLYLMHTYKLAAELEEAYGMRGYVEYYKSKAAQLEKYIEKAYWDAERAIYADTIDKDVYTQHANSLALLCGLKQGEDARRLALQIQDNAGLVQASLYFKYYVHLAMAKAGLGDNYMDWLDVWYENMELGLTTWGEKSNVQTTRSDCHAWSASPNVEFFRVILGIDSAAPGFKEVVISPSLGAYRKIGGSMPHPKGEISVQYELDESLKARIELPMGCSGSFLWKGERRPLGPGLNILTIQ